MGVVQVLRACLVLAPISVYVNAIPPVNWTFYRDMTLTWNEASQFCRDLGGHLPVIDSYLTQSAFLHWIREWIGQGHMTKTQALWTGLYSPTPGVAPYVWERDGAHHGFRVSFWDRNVSEPDRVEKEFCTRMPRNGLWRTKQCGDEYGVVCEFYEDCCTYIRISDTAALHTVSASRADVTSLEKCWSVCEGDFTCVSAAWHAKTGACNASSDAQEVPLGLGEHQNISLKLLQGCFLAETKPRSNPFTFKDTSDVAHPAEPQSVAPQNFQCTLTLILSRETTTPPTEATTTVELQSTQGSLPDTTQSQTTADTTQPQTTADTTQPQTTADTTQPQTTTDTTQPQTTADKTQFHTTPDTTQPQTTADTTQPQTTADTTQPQTTADTTQPQTTTDTTQPQTTSDTTQPQTTADTTQSHTTPDTTQSQTTADKTQSHTTPDTTLSQTTSDTTQSQTTSDTTQFQTTAHTTQPQTTADKTQSHTTPDTTQSQTTSDTTQSQTTSDTTQFQTTADPTQSQSTVDTTQSQTTSDTEQSQTMSDTPEPLTSTTTELVHDVNASSSSTVLRQCPCSCPRRLTTAPPPPPLEIVLANSTSKFRRAHVSEWSSPFMSESAISITVVTIAAMFVLFALCPHPAAIERCFCSRDRKTSASCSS